MSAVQSAAPPVKFCECGCGLPAPIAHQSDTKKGIIGGQSLRFIQGHNWMTPEKRAAMELAKQNTGLCGCGCGQRTRISTDTDHANGHVKGFPVRFIVGHYAKKEEVRAALGDERRYGRKIVDAGYVYVYLPDHPHANADGYVAEHVVVASRALGKRLPKGAIVHHVNENREDNQNTNLVICQSAGYHALLHARMRTLKERRTGTKTCARCGQTKPFSEYHKHPGNHLGLHPRCKRCRHEERIA